MRRETPPGAAAASPSTTSSCTGTEQTTGRKQKPPPSLSPTRPGASRKPVPTFEAVPGAMILLPALHDPCTVLQRCKKIAANLLSVWYIGVHGNLGDGG